MKLFLDGLMELGVVNRVRDMDNANKGRDLHDHDRTHRPRRSRGSRGSGHGGPLMHSMSKISAALYGQFGASHPIRRELAKAMELVKSGASVRGDDKASTVDSMARIIDGLSRQVLDLGATCQAQATLARVHMHELGGRAHADPEGAGVPGADDDQFNRHGAAMAITEAAACLLI